MNTIQVALNKNSYPIYLENGLIQKIPKILSNKNHGQRWVIISQHSLMELFGFALLSNMKKSNYKIDYITLPNGEAAKSMNEFKRVISSMIEMHCDRKTNIIALGGGVVGDLAGFIASSFLRGINYYQVPSTLLSMVDSSIGGKTGVNIAEGKNLIGSIYQPNAVFIDPELLHSLPTTELISGLGEVIKYGAIYDRSFLTDISGWLDDINSFPLNDAIKRSCQIKADIVSKDERELGIRRILNFGHTIGHAIEAVMGYGKIRHGEAISYGMKCAGWISNELGLISKIDSDYLNKTIDKLPLPIINKVQTNDLISFIRRDKKIEAQVLNFVALEKLGKAITTTEVSEDLIEKSFKALK